MSVAVQVDRPTLNHPKSPRAQSFRSSHAMLLRHEERVESEARPSLPTVPRSASYSQFPLNKDAVNLTASPEKGGMRRTFSETVLSNLDNGIWRRGTTGKSTGGAMDGKKTNKLVRRKSTIFRRESKVHISKITIEEQQANPEIAVLPKAIIRDHNNDSEGKPRSVTTSLSTLARKSWMGSSRSPSPSKRESMEGNAHRTEIVDVSAVPEVIPPEISSAIAWPLETGTAVAAGHETPLQRVDTGRKSRRPLSAFLGKSEPTSKSESPAVPSIPKSFSHDKLPSIRNGRPAMDSTQTLPRAASTERIYSSAIETPRKKDELWSTFRTLDGEFQKFASKPTTLKASIIRTTLIPFLRTYADHPSNTTLRAEDLDRRAVILNKWWTGLLEMLNGRNGQSVSGNDRPAVLEGVTGIMVRPEWRLPISAIHSRSDISRPPFKSRSTTSSTTSLQSSSSDFLAESVYHNVRNTFIQNLLSQMAFVVDRMSIRTVPASVVIFCGKAAAYAFIFCPGIAEILVRLWSLSSDIISRVLSEIDISRATNLGDMAEKISTGFPPHLRALAFKSLPSLMRHLRHRPAQSLSSAYIPWDGPWIARWAGRDSDLFFVFVRHYQILACEMLADEVTKFERACAPCYVLVQAQILAVLDATIHRAGTPRHGDAADGSLALTFDDILGPDTSATPLPLPAPNASRLMAENRLIMLLREILSESSKVKDTARRSFADSFGYLLKAASRRTSMFDHNACFTLCDFLEEAIAILVRFYHDTEDPVSFLDWDFWRQVCEGMLRSNNSMTEVRLYAFIYGLWGLITKNGDRKRDITLDWLLTEDHFQRQFNHWCPMVRAYYMRLLCWRIARYDGDGSEADLVTFATLSARLKQTWCYYLFLRENAEKASLPLPSTTPCSPAPGRRLLIIRDDGHPNPGGVILSFEGVLAASAAIEPSAYERHSTLDSFKEAPAFQKSKDSSRSLSPGRKKWDLFRNINPFTTTKSESIKVIGYEREHKMANGAEFEVKIGGDSTPSSIDSKSPSTPLSPQGQSLSFKFSLEWNDKAATFAKDRKLYPPRLPLPAQVMLQSKHPEPHEYQPSQPEGSAVGPSKYSGRALSEWALLVVEFQHFSERRKYEGVVGLKRIEIPTLGVDAFRRPA